MQVRSGECSCLYPAVCDSRNPTCIPESFAAKEGGGTESSCCTPTLSDETAPANVAAGITAAAVACPLVATFDTVNEEDGEK